jgi:hypothetical protein
LTVDYLEKHNRRKVRRVVLEDGLHAQQLFDLAASARRDWTLTDWLVLLKELDKCEEQVESWRRRKGAEISPTLEVMNGRRTQG